jgi:hypothetical protein
VLVADIERKVIPSARIVRLLGTLVVEPELPPPPPHAARAKLMATVATIKNFLLKGIIRINKREIREKKITRKNTFNL